jgi:hypothetical protein
MQLTYRGQSYTSSTPAIKATPSQSTAMFMGQPYVRKQYTVARQEA